MPLGLPSVALTDNTAKKHDIIILINPTLRILAM